MKFLVELRVSRTAFQPYGAIREFEPKATPQHRVFDNAWRWGELRLPCNLKFGHHPTMNTFPSEDSPNNFNLLFK